MVSRFVARHTSASFATVAFLPENGAVNQPPIFRVLSTKGIIMRREHIENIKPGDFVVIIGFVSDHEEPVSNPFDIFANSLRRPKRMLDGRPFKVMHADPADLPFILVSSGTKTGPLDVREVMIRKVTRQYVETYIQQHSDSDNVGTSFIGQSRKKRQRSIELLPRRKKKSKPDPKTCPRCGGRMVELRRGPGLWVRHCPECDCDFGQVE